MSRIAVRSTSDHDSTRQALATLISSTRNKRRPVPITEVARSLSIAVASIGSVKAVADRVGVSAKMLGQFAAVNKLTKKVKTLFEKRLLDSVDAVAHLAMLSSRDQEAVAQALAMKALDTKDVRAVVELRRVRKTDAIGRVIERVRTTKTQRHFVIEFIARGRRNPKEMARKLKKYLSPSEIIRLELDGPFGRLVVSEAGKKKLHNAATILRVPFKSVVQRALSEGV
jgi:hypothetical protein